MRAPREIKALSTRNRRIVRNHSNESWDDLGDGTSENSEFAGAGLTKYVEPLFIYKYWLVSCLLAACLLCWVALLVWPRTYESECKLQLNVGRESVGLDPSTTATQTLMMQKTQEEDVNSALELMGSRELAEQVVSDIGVDNILSGYLPISKDVTEAVAPSFVSSMCQGIAKLGGDVVGSIVNGSGVRDAISDTERAVIQVQKNVSISSPKKSSAMIIRAKAKTPQMAQAIVKSLATHFLTKHVNVSSTEGSLDFFVSQASDAEERVNRLLEKRNEMLQKHQIASTESKNNALTTQLASIETTILNTQAEMKRTDSEISDISMRMENVEKEVVATRQTSSDLGVAGMRSQLYALEMEEKRLAALYTSDHPRLVQIKERKASSTDVLEKLSRENESQSTTQNPLRLNLEERLLKAKTAAVGLTALQKELAAQKEEKEKEIRELLDLEVELSEVNREIDVSKNSLVSLRDKQEQARVMDSLRNKRISSIAISQPATFSEKPSDPKKILVIGTFMMLGLGGGLGLIGLKEFSRSTIRRPDEAERLLGYPVLANVFENKLLKKDSLASKKRTYKSLKSKKMRELHNGCRSIMSELVMGEEPTDESSVLIGRTIGIVSVRDGCGASSIAMVLAMESSNHEGLRTTLVDLDLRKRTVSNVFGLIGRTNQESNGLASSSSSDADFMHSLTLDSLGLVGTTNRNANRKGDVSVHGVSTMLQDLSRSNDFVIVDLPPANRPSNLMQIAKHLDQVIVVIESERTERQAAERLIARFEKMNVAVAGIVLNKTQRRVPGWLERLLG